MLRKNGWLCLVILFALVMATFLTPWWVWFRVQYPDGAVSESTASGYSLVMNDARLYLSDGSSVAEKKLLDESGKQKTDDSYVFALIFLCAAVGCGVAVLDRDGRRKAVFGMLCACLAAGLSLWMILSAGNRAYIHPDDAGISVTLRAGAGLWVAMGLSLITLGVSVMIFCGTPAAAVDEKRRTLMITRVGVLAAISAVLYTIPGIPVFPPIYKLDFSTVPVLLAGFSMGPLPGLCVLLVKDLIGLLSSSSGGVGELADFLTGAALMIPSALIYRKHRTLKGAMAGLGAGVAAMVLVGALVNYFIMIPFYVNVMNLPLETIIGMMAGIIPAIDSLPKLILLATVPFNLIKGAALTLVTCLLYKRLSPILKSV